tara:strand:+ start:226 stop:684 length:459 start_codon:yes stop_codon:yes gene_type:complete
MKYLHTMIRTSNLEKTLDFFCNKLGLLEVRKTENTNGRFTLVFLCAPDDIQNQENGFTVPLIEITYNWPDTNGKIETLTTGRNFGHLAFAVDNIYEYCQKLINKGVIINRPPRDGYMAFIKSPDNISIEILQKNNPLEISEPWASMPNNGNW